MAVGALCDFGGEGAEVVSVDVAEAVDDLFGAGDLEALALLDRGDESTGVEERVVGASVQPGGASAEDFCAELAALKVPAVDVGDLELAAGRGFEVLCDADYLGVVEVDAGDGVAGFGLGGFFFDGDGSTLVVELNYAVTLGVEDRVGEDCGSIFAGCGTAKGFGEVVAVKDVVAEDEAAAFAGEEFFADEEGLGEAVGGWLHGVLEGDAPLLSGAEKLAEARGVFGGGDDEDLADAREEQHRERVVDHRLVVDGEELLGDRLGDWMEPGAGAACEDDSLHRATSAVAAPRVA